MIYLGPGNISATWTIDGMTGAAACDAVHGANIQLQVNFGGSFMVPCSQTDPVRFDMLPSGNYSVDAKLFDSSGHQIYGYVYPALVNTDQTTNVVIPFAPPGGINVHWTVNGMPAPAGCMASMGGFVEVHVAIGDPPRATLVRPPQIVCSAGGWDFTDVQAGVMTVDAQMFIHDGDNYRPGQVLSHVATVTAGMIEDVSFAFGSGR